LAVLLLIALAIVLALLLPRLWNEAVQSRQPPTEAAPAPILPETPQITSPPRPGGLAPAETAPAEPPPAEPPPEPELEPEPEPEPAALPPETVPADTRGRAIFLVQADGGEPGLRRVVRDLPASLTPLRDSLDALLSGPSEGERALGMDSFIHPDVRLLAVWISGDTAIVDISDDFMINPRGNEGFEFQIRQIVWTATEFPGVQSVQFLVEGNAVDFLHGGIRIGVPIGR